MVTTYRLFVFITLLFALARPVILLADPAAMERGQKLYRQYCFICHQLRGEGSPGIFPPLAKSDFLRNKEKSISVILQGLSGPIVVNGKKYNGVMPPVPFGDRETADVLNYVGNSWGNRLEEITPEDVARVRSRLVKKTATPGTNDFVPLPSPPQGFVLREVVRPPQAISRLAAHPEGNHLFALAGSGDVFEVALPSGEMKLILEARHYLSPPLDVMAVGMTMDSARRLILAVNQRLDTKPYVTNRVGFFRSPAWEAGKKLEVSPWFTVDYPYGVGPYNHGVGHMAIGPDGYLYVSSGSRTDGNEKGTDPKYFSGGEVEQTACLWRIDPAQEKPQVEIFARGLRNPYGFCWDKAGRLIATDNGPDAHAPEELNWIRPQAHYGFPFQFSDWKEKPYPYTPDLPSGIIPVLPIVNLGPDGGFAGAPLSTFDPHSSPSGIVFLNDDFPVGYRDTFLVARFGNLLSTPRGDVGFDILQVRFQDVSEKRTTAIVGSFLKPLGRPVDLLRVPGGRIYIAEYSRGVDLKSPLLPGRILELKTQVQPGK